MKRLEFHISYICNHDCIFCSEYDRLKKYKSYPLLPYQIKTILLDRRKKGFNHVNFTGGEPTIIPNFLEILKFAKKIGYTIYVGTNGTMFASESFSQEALLYIDELSLSIHWFDAESCEKQTGSKNHFQIFQLIAKNIQKFQKNNFFFCNVVINKFNYQNTIDIIKFVKESEYPVQQILVSNIAPEGLADHKFGELVFPLEEIQKIVHQVDEYVRNNNIILRFFGVPTCVLGEEFKDYANDAHWEQRHTIERFTNVKGDVVLQDIHSIDNSRKRCFVDKCHQCTYMGNPCTGVFKRYLEYFSF